MKILMLLESFFPPDSRVEKEAISLSEAGHEIHILCYQKENQSITEKKKHFTIHRIKASGFFIKKYSALSLILPFYFGKWKRKVKEYYQMYKFDAIHVHDLPLSKVGYCFKKKYGTRLICDQHEFYSDWIVKTAHLNTPVGKLVRLLSNWKKYEKKYLSLADIVITVSEPLKDNYLKKYALNKNKILSVPNTPSGSIYNNININKEIAENYKSDFILFYAGGIDVLRGIDTAIVALKKLIYVIPNVKLLLAGKIVKPYDPFKSARQNGVEKALIFIGWIDEKDLPSYIAASDICFFTPPANRDEINKTIATKIYQYAIMNKPIIVSDAQMMKEFVEENNLGISIKSGSADEFYEAVLKMHNKEHTLKRMNSELWMWESTVKPLINMYEKI